MSASVARIGAALRVGPKLAWLIAVSGLCGVAAVATLSTRLGVLPLIMSLLVVALLTLVSLRQPLLPLVLFAILIPLEEVVVIEGVGTLSRVVGVLFAVAYAGPRLGHLTFRAMPAAGWAYLAWAALSLVWAVNPDVGWATVSTFLQLFILAFLVADFVVQRPAVVRPVLWAYSIAAAATAVIGIQFYLGQGLAGSRAIAIQGQDPAHFAAVLLPAAVCGLYGVLNGDRPALGAVVAFLATAGIVVSGTRSAWVAYVMVLVLFILPQLTPRRGAAAIATILVLLVGVYQIPGVPDLLAERSGNALSTGGAGRTDIWTVGLTIFGTAPATGVGYGNFPVAYTRDVAATSGATYWSALLEGRAPHNLVVGTLAELGLIGLLLLALFILPLLLRRGWGPHAAAVQAALASLCVSALFLDLFARKQVWLFVGLAAGVAYLARWGFKSREEMSASPPEGSAPVAP